MGYTAKAIANYFIDKAKEAGNPVAHLKLQKLVYLAHGWYLAFQDEGAPPLVTEYPEAWKYGPVFPSLYHELKINGSDPITTPAMEWDTEGYYREGVMFITSPTTPTVDTEDAYVISLLDQIWNHYGTWTGPQLSNYTHRPSSPWDQVSKERHNENIPDKIIQKYFKDLKAQLQEKSK